MSDYFANFPLIQYNGELCRSIINRAAMSYDVIKRTSVFYPYTNKFNERADTLSFHYYDTPMLDWLVYYANDIVDPYYGWYLTQDQFASMIADKYGSVYETQLKIHHYQVNWVGDDRRLTVSAYNALPGTMHNNTKQYWQPVLNDIGTIIHYVRKQDDRSVATNRVMRIEVPSTAGYQDGELVSQFDGGILTGYAEIVAVEATALVVRHVVGTVSIGQPLVGFASGTSAVPSAASTLSQSIPTAELDYWRSVSIYDYEEELNEQRKVLRLMDKRYAETAMTNLNTVFG